MRCQISQTAWEKKHVSGELYITPAHTNTHTNTQTHSEILTGTSFAIICIGITSSLRLYKKEWMSHKLGTI